MNYSPELLQFADGRAVTAENAEERRAEILSILSRNAYGCFPPRPHHLSGSMEETGFFLGLSVYFEKSEKVLLKPARSKACLGEFCSAAQMQEIAEEILRGSRY